ncbi:MAG: glycine--tRNA ligase [Candidatus Xenobia bacterium]|jgi:glycyl-tRNA synthetase
MPQIEEKKNVREDLMERIVSLCRRRGFIYPGSEIYGGLANCWDYGPLGSQLKKNVKDLWWRTVVQERDDMVGLDAAILMHPRTWEASGHVGNFSDPLVDCKKCKQRFRADQMEEAAKCPEGGQHEFTEVRQFNLMFQTQMGVVQDETSSVYLRPETAQGIFVNFKNVQTSSRKKLPFGIAQIGKSFRNEITPRRFTFRTREFEQMEIEYFVRPEEADASFKDWVDQRHRWYLDYGIKADNLRLRAHGADELAHYAKGCFDIEYMFPWGWSELEGIANRTDFDLSQHMKFSGKDLKYFDEETKEHVTPWVIEPSGGVDRAVLAFLVDSYDEDETVTAKGEKDTRVVLRLHPQLAPVQVAVLPLQKNKPELVELSQKLYKSLRLHFLADWDGTGQIGKRYRRYDEVGCPFCVTVDFDSLEDKAVTVRDRDSMAQERIPLDQIFDYLRKKVFCRE